MSGNVLSFYVMQTMEWAIFATVPSTHKTNKQMQRVADRVENMKLRQRFLFQLGAVIQINEKQYALYIHFHLISYVLFVEYTY